MADVTPLPKKKPVLDVKKDLRSISLTPCVAKGAEGFIVDDYLKPVVMSVIDNLIHQLLTWLVCYMIGLLALMETARL